MWYCLAMLICGGSIAAGQDSQPANQPQSTPASASAPSEADQAMVQYMDDSGRYLHHSRLTPGMKGYGLTVLRGQQRVRFDVEIVSVMRNWGPRQDVILAMLQGQRLDQTGPIQGMSGSPIYVHDDRDGKDKLIGAMAYGWSLQKECLVGIQPISQMLSIPGFVKPTDEPKARASGALPPEAMTQLLSGPRADFLKLLRRPGQASRSGEMAQLTPLATPLMATGLSASARQQLADNLQTTGLVLVQGGSGDVPATQVCGPGDLEPGSPLAVPLVEGDMDMSAMGTVTDIVDGRVIGFGHAFAGEGDVCLPMGPGYVHAIVSNLMTSFKLGAPLPCTGAITRDDQTGVAGVVGRSAQMIPISVDVLREDGTRQRYDCRLAQHQWLTPMLGASVIANAATARSDLPVDHTVRYQLEVEFEDLPTLVSKNVSSQQSISPVLSDLTRPLVALMNCPLAPPAKVKGIRVQVEVSSGACAADILDLKLDGKNYLPGQTVTGQLRLQPYRQPITSLPVSLKLPDDLDEGTYTLTAADAPSALDLDRARLPQRYQPRTIQQVSAMIQDVLDRRDDHLYLYLPTERSGVAIGQGELPNLPPSRSAMLMQRPRFDVKPFESALVVSQPTSYVLSGHSTAEFTVVRTSREIPVQGR